MRTPISVALATMALCASPAKAADAEQRFLSAARQITFEGRRAGEGYFAPDGKALIFQSEREPGNPFFQIYHLDLTTGDTHRVSPGIGKTTCAFFRPGTNRVLFSSTHLDPQAEARQREEIEFRASGEERRYDWDYDEHMDVFAADRDGTGLKRLTDAPGYDAEASYSPDGSRIVFTSLRSAYPAGGLTEEDRGRLETDPAYFGEIYVMDADGGNQTRLTDTPGYDGGPFFSADGERIIWRRFDEQGLTADIYTMRPDGTDVRRLTDFDSMSWAPYFHPSGEYAIFASNKHGFSNFELFLVDASGERQPIRVTHTDGFDGLPVFSPDGASLSWTTNRTGGGESQLFLAAWNHAAALEALAYAPERGETEKPSADTAEARLMASVAYLASDELEGRMTGSEGARRAADHIAGTLDTLGLEPAGEAGSYFQSFEFTAERRVLPEDNALRLMAGGAGRDYAVDTDFRPLSFSANAAVNGEVVFAGYGLSTPGGYDSYAGVDVTDKVVVVLRYVPEGVDAERRAELNRYAGLRYKAMIARDRGAKAILVVAGPNSPNAGKLIPLTFDNSLSGSGIVAASISGDVAATLFAGAGKDLKEVQSQLDVENPHFLGRFALEGVELAIETAVERVKATDRNVLARLPATHAGTTETVIVGAHYDHIGRGGTSSLARQGEEGEIHNGADDNASGVAVVLELARALADAEDRPRNVMFAFWSGEELGLIGSSRFVDEPPLALEDIVAYLNFDMVGRLRDNRLSLQGVGSSNVWRRHIERRNIPAGFNLALLDDPYLPTDSTAFYPKGVPILSFFTGSHEDYNRPTDDAETLDYAGMARIAAFGTTILKDVVAARERPAYVEVQNTTPGGGDRDTLRAYLGTIPDYATDLAGVKISSVRGGGPADKAGMRGGDVIVEFAGNAIANIYDYTYALDAVKIGEPVAVVVMRGTERVTLHVVPEARP